MRLRWHCLLILALAPAAVAAQERAGVVSAAGGYKVDFTDQDIRVVLSTLAEAAGVNITFSNLPQARTTLHLGQPVPKAQLLDVLRQVAEQNGLTFAKEGSLVRIGRGQEPALLAGNLGQPAAPKVEIYTYRLKHADAATIAPLLNNLFAGASMDGAPSADNNRANTGGGDGGGDGGGLARLLQSLGNNGNAAGNGNDNGNDGGSGAAGGGNGGGGRNNQVIEMNGDGGDGVSNCSVNGKPIDCGQLSGGPGGGLIGQVFQQVLGGGNANGGSNSAAPLVSQVRVVAEEASNTLLIRATPEEWGWIQKLLQDVDLRPLQVLIEAVIVEVTRTKDLNVGVDATVTHAYHQQRAHADLPQTPNARDFLLSLADHAGTVDFSAALNALATRGDVRIRSLPVIVGQNNQQAVLNVGASRPFVSVTQSAIGGAATGGVVQSVQYIDVGTKLQITPRINADGYVNLQVAQTANTATNEIQFDAPVINKREATTQVFLRDGQTTVLGGLADNTHDETRSGIPVLRDIPVLGGLFGSTHRTDTETELYVFLTPHIIAADTDIDRLRDSLQHYSPELRRAPVQPVFPGPATPKDSTP